MEISYRNVNRSDTAEMRLIAELDSKVPVEKESTCCKSEKPENAKLPACRNL